MRSKDFFEILSEHLLFREFDEETRQLLAGCARNEHFKAGQLIFSEGEASDKAFIIRKGDVAVELHNPHTAPLIIETLHEGDIFGWSWLVPPFSHVSDARAITDVSAISLDAACLRGKCDDNPKMGYEIFKSWLPQMVRRMRAMRVQLLDLYGKRKG